MQNDQPFFTITTISFDEKHLETLLKAVDLMNVPTQKEHACLERTTLAISSTKIVVFEKWGSKMGQNMHMLMQYSVAFYEKMLPSLGVTFTVEEAKSTFEYRET